MSNNFAFVTLVVTAYENAQTYVNESSCNLCVSVQLTTSFTLRYYSHPGCVSRCNLT